jgi:hypothetical protein
MATITFGLGGTHASFALALAAAAADDTLIGYGPYTETNQNVNVNKRVYVSFQRGPYTFNGSGVTAQLFRLTADRATINGGDQRLLRIIRYVGSVVELTAADCQFRGAEFTLCGTPGTPLAHVLLNACNDPEIGNVRIASNVNNQALLSGVLCTGAVRAPYIHDVRINALSVTLALNDLFGIALSTTTRAARVEDCQVYDCSSAAWTCGFRGQGPSAVLGQLGGFKRCQCYRCIGGTAAYGIAVETGSWDVHSSLVHSLTAPAGAAVGILHSSVDADPGRPYSTCRNNTVWNAGKGIWLFNAGGVPVRLQAQNNIVQDCTEDGYRHNGGAVLVSAYNAAYENGTDFNGWTAATGDTADVNPQLVSARATGGDFSLTAPTATTLGSPAIDTGTALTDVTADLNGNPRRVGYGQDRGCYEYQWPAYHDPIAVGLMPSQYRESLYLLALIAALNGNVVVAGATPTFTGLEELEQVFRDLMRKRWLANATGAQLDVLGQVLNITRTSDDDEQWRQRLYVRAAQVMCSGTTEELIALLVLLFPDAVQLRVENDAPPAKIRVFVQSPGWVESLQMTDWLQTCAAGGVGIWFSHCYVKPFGYCEVDAAHVVTPNPNVDHFGEVNIAHVYIGLGGHWAEVYKHEWEV